jgi:hypothetical protein
MDDFNAPFQKLCTIERMCREAYFDRLAGAGVSA